MNQLFSIHLYHGVFLELILSSNLFTLAFLACKNTDCEYCGDQCKLEHDLNLCSVYFHKKTSIMCIYLHEQLHLLSSKKTKLAEKQEWDSNPGSAQPG